MDTIGLSDGSKFTTSRLSVEVKIFPALILPDGLPLVEPESMVEKNRKIKIKEKTEIVRWKLPLQSRTKMRFSTDLIVDCANSGQGVTSTLLGFMRGAQVYLISNEICHLNFPHLRIKSTYPQN